MASSVEETQVHQAVQEERAVVLLCSQFSFASTTFPFDKDERGTYVQQNLAEVVHIPSEGAQQMPEEGHPNVEGRIRNRLPADPHFHRRT